MRVVFFGTSEFALPSLEQLVARQHAVVLCVTQPDRPQGRGLALEPSPVKQAAVRLRLPLAQPERLDATIFKTLPQGVDVGVAAAYGQLIRPAVLRGPAHGILGVHPSLLPKYRGAAPVAWALLNGDTETGVTIYRLNERLDAGEIVVQERAAIEPHEDAGTLTQRLAVMGAAALLNALELIEQGRAVFAPQHDEDASVAPKLAKAQGRIEWNAPAQRLVRLIRGMTPWPGASAEWHGEVLKVWSASAGQAEGKASEPPGTVMSVAGGVLVVSTGDGALHITEVQPPGRRRMSVKEFLAGHHIQAGEQLG